MVSTPRPRSNRAQSGNALVEYIILLVAVAVLLMTILVEYGAEVDRTWRQTDEDSVWDDVESGLDEYVPGSGADGENDCPHYFNSATGRWHDSETNLFVSFSDAEASGC